MLQTLANQLHCNVSSCTPALQIMFYTTLPYENICVCCVIKQKNILTETILVVKVDWITLLSTEMQTTLFMKISFLYILRRNVC